MIKRLSLYPRRETRPAALSQKIGMNETAHHSAFTLIEILVTLAILLVLCGLVLSAVTSAMRAAQEAACLQNISSLMNTTQTWIADNGGVIPEGRLPLSAIDSDDLWYIHQFIPNYMSKDLRCPINSNFPGVNGFRYAINDNLRTYFPNLKLPVPASRVVLVSEMYYFGDGIWAAGQLTYTQNGAAILPHLHQAHNGGLNFGFLDGHAELVKAPLLDNQPNWAYPPAYAMDLNSGYYYDEEQFQCMAIGQDWW